MSPPGEAKGPKEPSAGESQAPTIERAVAIGVQRGAR
jgi:hypothetical protein